MGRLRRGWADATAAERAVLGPFVVLRVLAVAGLRASRFVDSASYEQLDFTGRQVRGWTVPLLFELVPGDDLRVIVMAVTGALAWSTLALVASRTVLDRRVQIGVLVTVVALGGCTAITSWDTTILSESPGLTLTALLVAAWLWVARHPSVKAAGAVLAVTVLWTFVRYDHIAVTWFAALAAIVAAIRSPDRRAWVALAAGLVVIGGWAQWTYANSSKLKDFNLALVLSARAIPDAGVTKWFADHGMPVPRTVTVGQPVAGPPAETLLRDPDFARWVHTKGLGVYLQYLLEHPVRSALGPLDDMLGRSRSTLNDGERFTSMLAPTDQYGRARPIVPAILEQLLFSSGSGATVLVALVAAGIGLGAHRRRRGPDPRWRVPLGVIAADLVLLWVAWHFSSTELARLGLDASVSLRVALIVLGACLLDSALAPAPPPAEPVAR